ncbi:MAG: fibronectin type III domain-containing protein, partial [Bacteroidetes bacterium]|nr:fibronectin type III domain-containing protein [Bacteroidota bacterium]
MRTIGRWVTLLFLLFSALGSKGVSFYTSNPATNYYTYYPSQDYNDLCGTTYDYLHLKLVGSTTLKFKIKVSSISSDGQITFTLLSYSGNFLKISGSGNTLKFYLKVNSSSNMETLLCSTEKYPDQGLLLNSSSSTFNFSDYTASFTGTRYVCGVFVYHISGVDYRIYTEKIAITSATLNTPAQTSPDNNIIYNTLPSSITFNWAKNNPTGFANYELRIRDITNGILGDLFVFDAEDADHFTPGFTFQANHNYRWAVAAMAGGTEASTNAWYINISCFVRTNSQFADNIHCNYMTANWEAVDNANSYTIHYKKETDPSGTYIEVTSNSNSVNLSNLDPGIGYQFHVNCCSGNCYNAYSAVYTTSTPSLSIEEPVSGNFYPGQTVTVHWASDHISCFAGHPMRIQWVQNGQTPITIESNLTNVYPFEYQWTIGTNIQGDGHVKIYCQDFTSINNNDQQNNTITIATIDQNCLYDDCDGITHCGNQAYDDQTFVAVQYLCGKGVLEDPDNNNNVRPEDNIKRKELAKIAFYGIFGGESQVPAMLFSDYFPCVYTDLQDAGTYYYRAAKALLYLEYGDGIAPFDR